jgi:NAD(P)-dependent dehydrogenase (short-subunit alcohol dehydrogenase family)
MIPMASRLLRLPRMASRAYSSQLSHIARRIPEYNTVSTRGFHDTHRRLTASPTSEQSTLLPEFSLKDKVIVVSGGGRGLGLVQCEALLEAGAVVHAIDRLSNPEPDSEFAKVADRAENELGTSFTYHRLDVRDNAMLNDTVAGIADKHGRIDGLIAAAGIQQETSALEYTQEDCDKMMSVNVTGVFMTAQAVAKQMVKRKQGGSLVLIGSMSGTVANRGLICA